MCHVEESGVCHVEESRCATWNVSRRVSRCLPTASRQRRRSSDVPRGRRPSPPCRCRDATSGHHRLLRPKYARSARRFLTATYRTQLGDSSRRFLSATYRTHLGDLSRRLIELISAISLGELSNSSRRFISAIYASGIISAPTPASIAASVIPPRADAVLGRVSSCISSYQSNMRRN